MGEPEFHEVDFKILSEEEMIQNSELFLKGILSRRTIRDFSNRPVNRIIIENCIRTAASAPSGANRQPWKFLVVSDTEVKKIIRERAEVEEEKFYRGNAGNEWLEAVSHLGTNEHKPFLEKAPYLIVIFEEKYAVCKEVIIEKNYHTKESVGIATGFLIAALHNCGLATLTYTPSPMNFLNEILNQPQNLKPFLILVTGYPAENVKVPIISKKEFDDVAKFI